MTRWLQAASMALLLLAHAASASAQTQVMVVSTLHRFHESVPGYSYQALRELLERLQPDVLAVELTPSDLRDRRQQAVKTEYNQAVYPYLQRRQIHVIALEPEGDEAVRHIQAGSALGQAIETSATLGPIANGLDDVVFSRVKQRWQSAADVNSDATDIAFEIKHEAAKFIYGEAYYQGWDQWNRWMFERLQQGLAPLRGQALRVLVLVGAEHGYWFRRAIKAEPGMRLIGFDGW